MSQPTLQQLVPVIQMAIGPVILISGIGLLLLSLTNRYGRIIDRARSLTRELPLAGSGAREQIVMQLAIIHRRARILRMSIILGTTSVLLAGLLIMSLFAAAMLRVEAAGFMALLFILCVASLVVSLVLFLVELQASLNALKVELDHATS